MQGGDDGLDGLYALALGRSQLLDLSLGGGNELMQRGVQETDAHRASLQGLIELLKVTLLIGQDLVQSGLPLCNGIGADHLPESSDPLGVKEHMLGTAQANALCAQLLGLLGIGGGIGIGADLHGAVLVGQSHNAAELTGDFGIHSGDNAFINIAG